MKRLSGGSAAPESGGRSLRMALRELGSLSVCLSVPPEVTDEAARVCTRGLERGFMNGRTRAQMTASSLYAACREKEVLTTLDDVAAASGVRRDEVARCYRLLVTELDMQIPILHPAEYVDRLASKANIDAWVQARALEILSKAERKGTTAGKDPIGLAASALYLAATLEGQKLTQRSAAEAAGVAEATVRNESKRLRTVLATP